MTQQQCSTLDRLSNDKIVTIGFCHILPVEILSKIAKWVMVFRDHDRLNELVEYLSYIQNSPCSFTGECNREMCDLASVRVSKMISNMESLDVMRPITIITYDKFDNEKYITTWRLIGETSRYSTLTPDGFTKQISLCDSKKTFYITDFSVTPAKKRLLSNISTNGWDGSLPGDKINYSLKGPAIYPGWFADEITFILKLMQEILKN